jgi:acyl-CoA dehydrogenase
VSWDFTTDPEFQEKLDWASAFVREEVEPLDLAFPHREFERPTPDMRRIIDPLKQRTRDEGLWACHLEPELGGKGYGQLKLALLNEVLGRSRWAPIIFGCQAPDTGNAEILAHYGTEAQKERYLTPLLNGEIFSCYSMTEPHAGADPRMFTTRAWRDGDEWVIEGEKFFSSNAKTAEFLIVMTVTDPDVDAVKGMSMILVPTDTPGVDIKRNIGTMGEPINEGLHGYIHYDQVRVPYENLLGGEGEAFAVAQTRLGGGRIHHAMRTIARGQMALDMMCQRALSRRTQGSLLADKQMVQEVIADSWTELLQFRLMVLYTAWLIDEKNDYRAVRAEIAACKVQAAKIYHDVVYRALHLHGALGVSNEMPLAELWMSAPAMGIVDGPTEVHQVTIARQILRKYKPYDGTFPPAYLPPRIEAAKAKFAAVLEQQVGNL